MAGIELGVVCTLFDGTLPANTTSSKTFYLDRGVETVLVSFFAEDVQSTLDVTIYTLTEEGKEVSVLTFPQLVAPTTELLLQKAAAGMQRFRVEMTTGAGPATFEIRAKGIGVGELTVKIESSSAWSVTKTMCPNSPTVLVPISLTDRSGLALRNANFQSTDILYVAETVSKLTSGLGYPVLPGEALQLDVKAGSAVYGLSSGGTIDVRIIQVGG